MKEYKRFTEKVDSGFVSELDCRIAYNKLCAIEDKIENGTLIELPCSIGSTIYFLVTKTPKRNFPQFTFIKKSKLTYYNLERASKEIGKTAFITQAQAEARLEKLKKEKARG